MRRARGAEGVRGAGEGADARAGRTRVDSDGVEPRRWWW